MKTTFIGNPHLTDKKLGKEVATFSLAFWTTILKIGSAIIYFKSPNYA